MRFPLMSNEERNNRVSSNVNTGHLTVYTGPMFSGKTEALISDVRRTSLARRKVLFFSPEVDTRHQGKIISHQGQDLENQTGIRPVIIKDFDDITLPPSVGLIAIDEAQFFGPDVVSAVELFLQSGRRVSVAGLDLDSKGAPFGVMPFLLGLADEVVKCKAVCMDCGEPATRTYCHAPPLVNSTVLIGSSEVYQAMCLKCWFENRQMDDFR